MKVKKYISSCAIITILSASLLGVSHNAYAQTNASQTAQIQALLQIIAQLQAQLAQISGSHTNTASITTISNSKNPTVTGKASGTDMVSFSISNSGKVYDSGNITVKNGTWSHRVTKTLSDGMYVLAVYINNIQVADTIFKVDVVHNNPSITLTSPRYGTVYNKQKLNDDVVLQWDAQDVPVNTNVLYTITATKIYAGSAVTGIGGQVEAAAGSGTGEHRIAIDVPGTLDAGEYKVQLSLQQCHSLGCSASYTFGPLKENLKTYDTSEYGYFTVINTPTNSTSVTPTKSGIASVNLVAFGKATTDTITANIADTLTFNYYPQGNIDSCKVTAKYDGGDTTVDHPWPNTITAGQYGRATFSVTSVYPRTLLQQVRVECKNGSGAIVASDAISVQVNNSALADYKISVGGSIESGTGITEAEAHSRCTKKFNDNSGKLVQCWWNEKMFFNDTNWKG